MEPAAWYSIDYRSIIGITAGVAAIIGLGYLTTKEEDIKDMKTKHMEKVVQKRKKLNIQFPYPAPEGWKWYMNENAIFGMLIPLAGWELEEEQSGFILSSPTPNSQIPTIFSASCFPRHPEDAAQKFMEEFNKKISSQPGVKVLRDWQQRSMGKGAFTSYNMTYEDSDPNTGISGIIHNQLMINPATGTMYYVMFESPTEQYEEMWTEWGKKMFNSILLSPGV